MGTFKPATFTADGVRNTAKEIRLKAARTRREEMFGIHGAGDFEEFYADYEWIEQLFEDLARTPDPRHSTALADTMADLVGEAPTADGKGSSPRVGGMPDNGFGQGDLSLAGSVQNLVDDWQGHAATEFHDSFLANLDPCRRNQIVIGKILRDMARTNAELLETVRADTIRIQTQTLNALDAVLDGSGDLSAKLGILSAAACLAGGFCALPLFTAASGAAAAASGGFTMLSGVLSGAGSLTGDDSEPVPLAADTVDGVLANMTEAVNAVVSGQYDCENDLVKCLEENTMMLYENAHEPVFVSRRPYALDDAAPGHIGDHFRPPV